MNVQRTPPTPNTRVISESGSASGSSIVRHIRKRNTRMASNTMIDDMGSSSRNVEAEVENEDNDELNKFVPPPEYDENDSRWTLKYREPAPGLVEIMENSGVYVNFDKLAECQKWSNDCKTFAANLLTEIFTESALTTCSWSGLDKHAKNMLLQFVAEYGQIRDWMRTDYQCILKGFRQVMLEMKCTQKRKEEKAEEEPLNEDLSNKRPFLLPPETDQNNSRWTLKYREYAPGLDELIYDSSVYVEGNQLTKCKRLAKDSVTLARMLLTEIFTIRALSICSLSADHGTNIRPVLDENAMTTLLKFVAENERKNKWIETENKCIISSIQQKLEVLRRVKRIKEQEEEYDGDISDSFIISNEIFLYRRKFLNLPPEYEENDSRWTLKYREPAPGLVELMEHSEIYVNADKLSECKRLSNDCPTLARKLLTEVFTKNALGACSLSKKNHECYKPYCATSARFKRNISKPELDAHAEIILLNFVDEYGLEMSWPVSDFCFIRKSMINKMSDIEDIYSMKEEQRRRADHDKKYPMC